MWKTVAACAFDALEILGERYLHAGRQSHGMGLSTPKYAWARIGLMPLIPIAVLNEYEPRFGIVGKLCVKWGEAYHHILCVFSPDAVQLVWTSSCRYTRGYAEASFHTVSRTGDVAFGLYLLVALLFSTMMCLPGVVYDVYEGLWQEWMGVVARMS
ncbi:hypothetical protein PInf_011715 [Phytophthora infestans]|nr:hypothetical protein PInf_011715 [Phytophthora infestans]